MKIKDESVLRRMHPNYDDEIEIIENIFGYFLKLVDKNLTDYLADKYRIIHRKNYLFSSQVKEIFYNDGTNPDYNVNLGYNYEKDGSIFSIFITSKSVINSIIPDCLFDKINIDVAVNSVIFSINGRDCVNLGYFYDGEQYMLTSYNANFDVLRTLM